MFLFKYERFIHDSVGFDGFLLDPKTKSRSFSLYPIPITQIYFLALDAMCPPLPPTSENSQNPPYYVMYPPPPHMWYMHHSSNVESLISDRSQNP